MSFGLERRALVFWFNTTIQEGERNVNLERTVVETELSGVLNHCIAGWKRLQARGFFLEPESCREAKRTWLGKRNTLASFVSECLTITGDLDDELPAMDVWAAFQIWSSADNSGLKWGRNTFYDEIGSVPGVLRFTREKTQWFRGIVISNVPSVLDDLGDLDDVDVDNLI
jgi:phage/plasmid-associated DNA primase